LQFKLNTSQVPINLSKLDDIDITFQKDDEIVVYCSDQACIASQYAYIQLEKGGCTNGHWYAGGLFDWSAADYDLERFAVE